MEKRILLGSIIAVVILVLVSFTGVVGYQTTSSTITRASPLFSVRSSRAINEESKDLNCDYIGKGNRINIPLPTRNSKAASFDRLVDIIKRMDDKSIDRFVDLIIKHLNQRDNFKEYNKEEIILSLNQLRNNPSEILPYIQEEETNPPTYGCTFTWPYCYYTIDYDIRACIFLFLVMLSAVLIGMTTWIIYFFCLFTPSITST